MSKTKVWYNISSNKIDKNTTDIFIDGIIHPWEESSKDFVKEFNKIKTDNINLYINSPGGSVIDGYSIYNIIKASSKNITSYITGSAFSIASVIALASDKVISPKNSLWLIHEASGCVCGNAVDLRKEADLLEKINDQIADIYVEKTNNSKESILSDMKEERFFTGQEAFDYGLVDEVTPELKAVAQFDDSEIKNYKHFENIKKYFNIKNRNSEQINKKEGLMSMTKAELEKDYPELVNEIKNGVKVEEKVGNAVIAERNRISEINSLLDEDNSELINKAIKDGISAQDTALLILKNQKAIKKAEADKLLKNKNLRDKDGKDLSKFQEDISGDESTDKSQSQLDLEKDDLEAKKIVEDIN